MVSGVSAAYRDNVFEVGVEMASNYITKITCPHCQAEVKLEVEIWQGRDDTYATVFPIPVEETARCEYLISPQGLCSYLDRHCYQDDLENCPYRPAG